MEFIIGNYTFLISIIALVLTLILCITVVTLRRKINRLLGSGGAKSIEESLILQKKHIDDLLSFQRDSIGYFKNVEERLRRSVQGVETLRFNPFKGTGDGGNQSFVTSFINEKGDGVIISSLYTRERVSVFSKPIKDFKSEYELSEEEIETLNRSKTKVSTPISEKK